MAQTISVVSTEYVRVPISITKNGVTFDPTSDSLSMSFGPTAAAPTIFHTGTWEVAGTNTFALCLIGPGGNVQLTPGTWFVYVKVTDSPEVPVKYAGTIQITA